MSPSLVPKCIFCTQSKQILLVFFDKHPFLKAAECLLTSFQGIVCIEFCDSGPATQRSLMLAPSLREAET